MSTPECSRALSITRGSGAGGVLALRDLRDQLGTQMVRESVGCRCVIKKNVALVRNSNALSSKYFWWHCIVLETMLTGPKRGSQWARWSRISAHWRPNKIAGHVHSMAQLRRLHVSISQTEWPPLVLTYLCAAGTTEKTKNRRNIDSDKRGNCRHGCA